MTKGVKMIALTVALLSGTAGGGDVSEVQARTVASNFAQGDSTLRSRTVDAVTKRGNLWVVSLQPSGYVAVSANDAAYPIVLFSDQDFVEPRAGTPFADVLRALDSDIAQATGDDYRTIWNRLLGIARSVLKMAAASVATESEVRVSVPSAWQQCQPFNDFMPIEYASGNSIDTIYRGRRFLGCVPTAYVQIMNYWQWPEVIDSDVSEELRIPAEKYEGVNPITSYTPRIKAGTALEWNGTQAQYPFDVSDSSGVSSGVYDLRGYLSEKKRLCVGRACLLSQIISKASLKTTGTGATLAQPTANDWYERPTSIDHGSSGDDDGTDPDWYFGEVKKALQAGIPLLVGIDVASSDGSVGHAVVGTGWKYENGSHFYELNYGWGGGSAWYSYASIKARLGCSIAQRPKPKPLLVNQPDASALPLKLQWHFPKKGWEHVLTGFKVYASEYGTTLEDKTDTFDTNPGTASGDHPDTIFTGTYPGTGNETPMLVVQPSGSYGKKTYYVWNEPKTLSADSTLTFRLRANDTRGITVVLQTNVDGAGWQDAYAFARSDQAVTDWQTVTVPLSGRANGSIRFRLFVEKTASANAQWTDDNPVGYMIDDFTVTKVESIGAVNPIEIASVDDPAARSVTISQGLEVGARYALKVCPVFAEGTSVDSDYIPIRIVGDTLAAPQFVSITSVPKNATVPAVQEDCFRECALGQNYLCVQGSATMTELKAYSSHVSILPDSKISVASVPNHAGRFLVAIDGSEIAASGGRQRMILTLVGSNAYGAKVQKDLTLRLSSETKTEAEVNASDLDDSDEPGGGDDPGDDPSTPDDPDEPAEETPVIETTFPAAADAGPNDDATAMTRFCPGVTATAGAYDVTRSNSNNYLIPAAHNLLAWWLDRYETAYGVTAQTDDTVLYTPGSSDTGYTLQSYTSALFDQVFLSTLPAGTTKSQYFPAKMTAAADWQEDATSESDPVIAMGRHIYAALANGPIGIQVRTSSMRVYGAVVWGCAYATDATGPYATALYVTDTALNARTDNKVDCRAFKVVTNNASTSGPGLEKFNNGSTPHGIIESLYPISGPVPEASGDGEVMVKVTADGKTFDISQAFSKVEKGADGVVTYTLDQTPGKKIQVGDEQIAIRPELADETPFKVQEDKLVFQVKSIPGLRYQVLASDSLDPASFKPAGEAREAIGPRRELTVLRTGETKGFYKIQVSR